MKKNLKITIVLPFPSMAGGIRVALIYATKLIARGHVVTVVTQPPTTRVGLKDRLRILLGRKIRPKFVPHPMIADLSSSHRMLDEARPVRADDVPDADIIVATWWETAEWVSVLPETKGRKFYLLQDYEVFPEQPAARVISTFSSPLHKIAVSPYIRDRIQSTHGPFEIDVVPNSVDTDQFTAPPRRRGKPFRVGFVYTTTQRKNVGLAIRAAEKARERNPEMLVLAFGTASPSAHLPLPNWVDYHQAPEQSVIPELYAACDAWLFTSTEEGFGLPILEAMACRTPVLATRAGAAPDLIDGMNGLLVDQNESAFVDAIDRLMHCPEAEWQNMSNAAINSARQWTWDDATAHLEDIFLRQIEKGRGSSTACEG